MLFHFCSSSRPVSVVRFFFFPLIVKSNNIQNQNRKKKNYCYWKCEKKNLYIRKKFPHWNKVLSKDSTYHLVI